MHKPKHCLSADHSLRVRLIPEFIQLPDPPAVTATTELTPWCLQYMIIYQLVQFMATCVVFIQEGFFISELQVSCNSSF